MQEQLLEEIRDLLAAQNANSRLWRTREVANYLNLAVSTTQQSITCKTSFPEPITLPCGGKRWHPNEVKEWAASYRGKKGKQGRPREQ